MTEEEKAKIIHESLEERLQLDYSFEKYYFQGIKSGLNETEILELDKEKSPCAATQKAKMVCKTNDINFFIYYIKKIRSESIKGAD